MSATQSRIAPMYYDTLPRTLPDLPKTPAGRREAMADAVFASVLALQGLLTDKDPKVVIQAAGMILDLDKTRMRHSSHVAGTSYPSPLGPLESDWGSLSKTAPASVPPAPPEQERPVPPRSMNKNLVRESGKTDEDNNAEKFDQRTAAPVNVADPMVAFIERMRKVLQEEADEKGSGEVVSWARAESVAHQYLADEEYHRATKLSNDSRTRTPKASTSPTKSSQSRVA